MNLVDYIELALKELEADYTDNAKRTLFTIIEDIRKGNLDLLCPNCGCNIEIEKS